MILAENNVVFPNSDSKITINTYKIRLGQKLRMLPNAYSSLMLLKGLLLQKWYRIDSHKQFKLYDF